MLGEGKDALELAHGLRVVLPVLKLPLLHRLVDVRRHLGLQVMAEHLDVVAQAEVSVEAFELVDALFDLAQPLLEFRDLRSQLLNDGEFLEQLAQLGAGLAPHLFAQLFVLDLVVLQRPVCVLQNVDPLLLLMYRKLHVLIVVLFFGCFLVLLNFGLSLFGLRISRLVIPDVLHGVRQVLVFLHCDLNLVHRGVLRVPNRPIVQHLHRLLLLALRVSLLIR